MRISKQFALLSEIAKRQNAILPQSEEELIGNQLMLDWCVDELLASELSECGFDGTDEPNAYGYELEDAIDYFNRFRLR